MVKFEQVLFNKVKLSICECRKCRTTANENTGSLDNFIRFTNLIVQPAKTIVIYLDFIRLLNHSQSF
jgi:hypothetical protein